MTLLTTPIFFGLATTYLDDAANLAKFGIHDLAVRVVNGIFNFSLSPDVRRREEDLRGLEQCSAIHL